VQTDNLKDQFAVIDCIPLPIFVLDVCKDGIPVYAHCNPTLLEQLELDFSNLAGKTAIEAFGTELGSVAYNEQLKTIASRAQNEFEFRFKSRGNDRYVRTTHRPQIDATGRVVRLVGSLVDISNEKIAKSTQEKLDGIGTEVEQFIAMAAHDLRSPMRNVMDLADLLYDDFEDHGDGKLELIALLKETAEKSMDLISDVLSYATTLGPAAPNCVYNLTDLCQDLMIILDPQNQHTLICNDLNLIGEKSTMQIILRNLIDNALKHGNREHLTLQCDATLTDAQTVEVSLSDNGAGFENPGIAFLESGEFRMESGYGLLAIRKLVTARGGNITAFNFAEVGGSCVRFTLPNTIDHTNSATNDDPHVSKISSNVDLKQQNAL
jgi:signal transduction histidine kinase